MEKWKSIEKKTLVIIEHIDWIGNTRRKKKENPSIREKSEFLIRFFLLVSFFLHDDSAGEQQIRFLVYNDPSSLK